MKSKGFDIEVELNHLVERRGFMIQEIPICYRARLGEKKLKVSHGVTILKRILLETTFLKGHEKTARAAASINRL